MTFGNGKDYPTDGYLDWLAIKWSTTLKTTLLYSSTKRSNTRPHALTLLRQFA
jgi:hypothetical protein